MRGEVYLRDRAKQQRDYSGLTYGKITPQDIDMHIEYHDLCHILGELKYLPDPSEEPRISRGQELADERLCDDLNRVKPTIFIIATHSIDDPAVDIPAAECKVFRYRRNGKWVLPQHDMTVKELVDFFIEEVRNLRRDTVGTSAERIPQSDANLDRLVGTLL